MPFTYNHEASLAIYQRFADEHLTKAVEYAANNKVLPYHVQTEGDGEQRAMCWLCKNHCALKGAPKGKRWAVVTVRNGQVLPPMRIHRCKAHGTADEFPHLEDMTTVVEARRLNPSISVHGELRKCVDLRIRNAAQPAAIAEVKALKAELEVKKREVSDKDKALAEAEAKAAELQRRLDDVMKNDS